MVGPDYNENAGGLRHPDYGLLNVPQFGWEYAGDEEWIKDATIMIVLPVKTISSDDEYILEIAEVEGSPEGSDIDEEHKKSKEDQRKSEHNTGQEAEKSESDKDEADETENGSWDDDSDDEDYSWNEGSGVEMNEDKDCTGGKCPSPIDGGWGSWQSWSSCGSNCMTSRYRSCNDPPPEDGGLDCSGSSKEHKECNKGKCALGWGGWSLQKDSQYLIQILYFRNHR